MIVTNIIDNETMKSLDEWANMTRKYGFFVFFPISNIYVYICLGYILILSKRFWQNRLKGQFFIVEYNCCGKKFQKKGVVLRWCERYINRASLSWWEKKRDVNIFSNWSVFFFNGCTCEKKLRIIALFPSWYYYFFNFKITDNW